MREAQWERTIYQSGTQTVSRFGSFTGAYYHIGHLADDTEGDGGRSDVGKELANWLNGGEEPWWMDMLFRVSPDTVRTPHGCHIRATGPMVDTATPPSWGLWEEDDSCEAQIERGLMTDALMKRDRSLVEGPAMSDTPRTDDEESLVYAHYVPGDFARSLERELNAAQARIAELESAPTPLPRPDRAGWWWKWNHYDKDWYMVCVEDSENGLVRVNDEGRIWDFCDGQWLPATPPPAPEDN